VTRASAWLAIATSVWFVLVHSPALHDHSDSDSGKGCAICQALGSVTLDVPTCVSAPPAAAIVEEKHQIVPPAGYAQPLLDNASSPRGPPTPPVIPAISL
jgi:hypothetical protein